MNTAVKSDLSFLDIVDICDNVHLHRNATNLHDTSYDSEILVPLYLSESTESPLIGLLRPIIVEQLKLENERCQTNGAPQLWSLRLEPYEYITLRNGAYGPSASLRNWLDTPSKRTGAMKELCERWRDAGLFSDVCGPTKWRSEMYPVYSDPFGVHDHPLITGHEEGLNYAFEMERSACALFGIVTYGVHLSIYDEVVAEDGQRRLRVWVPTRALTKPTFPGYLDNTVAGGIPSGMSTFESLIKECMEEASIEPELVRKHTRAVGSISYFFRTAKGWLQPEIEYVYDIVIPPGVDSAPFTPRPSDGEVESFEFVSHGKLLQQLRAGLFKPNCGLVILDLFIRLGYITPDNEPEFMKIIRRLHGDFDYGFW
ncbi:nudix hydrolase 20 [Gymnopilus junonius]|uniref:Nudix hydrolase 20 n=1 Tax=Gymnopilus junonius TaxID=109634 RepID=A0A9P5NRG5_GYMJU|nr:nudix hydrolase 20 [Gymnopilus junonius]